MSKAYNRETNNIKISRVKRNKLKLNIFKQIRYSF